MCQANLFAGVLQKDIAEQVVEVKKVKRYNEHTGIPYDTSVEETYWRVCDRRIEIPANMTDSAVEFLQQHLLKEHGLEYSGSNDTVVGIRVATAGRYDSIHKKNDSVAVSDKAICMGIDAAAKLLSRIGYQGQVKLYMTATGLDD